MQNKTSIFTGILLSVSLILSLLVNYYGYLSSKQQSCELYQKITEQEQRINKQEQLIARYQILINNVLPTWDVQALFFSKLVEVTVYTSRPQETDNTPWTTANNTSVRPGGIAVSRDLFQELGGFGVTVILKGYGVFVVNDVMNERFTNSVDIWAGDLKAARKHGRQETTLHWQ